jgi:hypothetical protein
MHSDELILIAKNSGTAWTEVWWYKGDLHKIKKHIPSSKIAEKIDERSFFVFQKDSEEKNHLDINELEWTKDAN